jgi:uncharacterized repeat protein (TIGR01451 family)
MRLITRITQLSRRSALVAVSLVTMASFGLFTISPATADVSLGGPFDSDSNAVIFGGAGSASQVVTAYNNGDGHNSAASIQAIYSFFGISSAAVRGMPTTAVAGSVTRDGQVFVGNQVVATGALTAGRQNMAGSTAVSSGGTTFFTRPPSVSFASSPLSAYVVMNGGRFQFAILSSCGNPIKATPVAPPPPPPAPAPKPKPAPAPTPTPNYTIQKLVAIHGSNNFAEEVTVHPNTDVDYRVIIKSTGNAAVANLTVNDTLPSDDSYVSNTLTRDGQVLTGTQPGSFFGGAFDVGTLPAGGTTTFTFEALAGANQNNANCNPETLPNVAHMTATSLPPENATATVSVECMPAATPPVTTTPPPTPAVVTAQVTPPPQLVNTGPGQVIGLFTAATLVGAFGYRHFLSRRLGR